MTTNGTAPPRGPQLALDDERALLALYDLATRWWALGVGLGIDDPDDRPAIAGLLRRIGARHVPALLRDAGAALERLGVAAGAPERWR